MARRWRCFIEPISGCVRVRGRITAGKAVPRRHIRRGWIEDAAVVAPGKGVHQAAGTIAQAQEIAGIAQAVANLPIWDADDGRGDGRVVSEKMSRVGSQNEVGARGEHKGGQQISAQVVSQRPATQAQERVAVIAQFQPFPGAVAAGLDAVVLHFGHEYSRRRQGRGRRQRLIIPEDEPGELSAVRGADGDPVGINDRAASAGDRGDRDQAGRINFHHVVIGKTDQGLRDFQAEAAIRPRQVVEEPPIPGVGMCAGP